MEALELLSPTKRRILEELHRSRATAQSLASALGLQVSAVRGHLDNMEAQGLLVARFRRAGVGRPRKVYALSAAGEELFPRRYHLLLSRLLARLVEKEGKPYVGRLLAEVAQDVASGLRVPREAGVEERARGLAQALNTLGFEASIEATPQGLLLVRRNCIFLESAKEHDRLVCGRFDQELVRSIFGGDTELQCCMATGSGACRNLLAAAATPAAQGVAPKGEGAEAS